MKIPSILILLLVLIPFSACSKKQSNAKLQTSGAQNSNNITPQQSEISANGEEVINNAPKPAAATYGETKGSWYNTEVYELFDGFGNKTENRIFKDHPRLTSVIVATTAKGEQTVEVYGQNGERKQLSADMVEKALKGTGDEIADAAGIFQTKKQVQMPEFSLTAAQAQNPQTTDVTPKTVSPVIEEPPIKEAVKVETTEQTQTTQKTEILQSSVKTESKTQPNNER
ncbi:MAG TPA: hypothetical protein VF571_20885 [Pyrinomonadaceae bacterium]|jgi:hypothetical protein